MARALAKEDGEMPIVIGGIPTLADTPDRYKNE